MAFEREEDSKDDDRKELTKEDYKKKFQNKARKRQEGAENNGEKPIKLLRGKPDRSKIVYDPDDEWEDE